MEGFEYVTIRENLSDICDCISEADLVRFSMELLQHDIISNASHQAAIAVSGSTPANKIAHLVTEVMNKVKFSPEYFHKFLSILESRSKKLHQSLRKRYFELQGGTPDEPTSVILTSPGKPHVSPVSYDSIQITWKKPDYDGDVLIKYYRISYRAMSDPNDKWSTVMTEDDKSSYLFQLAESWIAYVFTVSAITTAGHSSESEVSDSIEVKPRPWGTRMLHKCELIQERREYKASIYQLPLQYTMKRKNIVNVTVGESVAVRSRGVVPHKVLMVVGATGAGKSTLINAMANYIMGVDWEDEYRFKLISEEDSEHDQSKSQTQCITAYTFNKDRGSPLPYSLTVIDTPGLANTGGFTRDKKILVQVKEFFSLQGDEGVAQLHGIGFVTQASLARLTPVMRYAYDSIFSVFGKDVADNIFLMVTFADGKQPPVLDAVRAAGVPFKSHFKFNNSARLFASNKTDNEFGKMFWKMGHNSFEDFFNDLSRAPTQSLQQSKEVLQQREQLETAVQSLQPWFHDGRFQNVDQDVIQLIEQARQSLRCLQQIALKPNYLIEVEYVRLLIESEKQESRAGWRERVKTLEELKKQAKIVSTLAKHGQKF